MPTYLDQLGREVTIDTRPSKIISVVPSQTELLFSLGLNEEIIGITKFCVHPHHWFRTKERIGGTKKLDIDKIRLLKPDLILANKEENTKEQIELLAKEFPVWISDINNLDDALKMIQQVGLLVGKQQESDQLIYTIRSSFTSLNSEINATLSDACYLIWKDPLMTIGGDTFISHMLPYAGFKNVFSDLKRYPQITIKDIIDSECEILLLSSEPFPFTEKHIEDLKTQLPDLNIILVDGEMFSWYGSRLVEAVEYFNQLKSKVKS